MINAVGEYTRNLSMIIIFSSFINLIMPESDFKKYIKLVLGFIVILTILSPLNNILFKNQPSYLSILEKYEWNIEKNSEISKGENYLSSQKDIILENYNEKIITQIKQLIETGTEVSFSSAEVFLNDDINSEDFGTILKINLVVNAVGKKEKERNIYIPKIKIGNKAEKGENPNEEDEKNVKTIKKCLIDFYNLDETNIDITILKNS